MIDVISRALNPYQDFDAYLKLAEQPEMLEYQFAGKDDKTFGFIAIKCFKAVIE